MTVYRIYVSSNYRMKSDYDLKEYRAHLKEQILSMGLYPHVYEIFEEKTPITETAPFLFGQIQKADIFLGIYAHQYGFIPDRDHLGNPNRNGKSTVEMEYEWSQELNIPCSFYILHDDAKCPSEFREGEPELSRLKALKDRIKREHYVNIFSRLGELLNQTSKDLVDKKSKLDEKRRDTIIVHPFFGLPVKSDQFRKDIFVVMPFAEKYVSVFKTIQSLESDSRLKLEKGIERADNFYSKNDIITEIWSAIYFSRLVIADCSDRNPNVFYELGIAHTLGKPAILITRKLDDVPFDLRQLRVILYEGSEAGLENLCEKLSIAIHIILKEN